MWGTGAMSTILAVTVLDQCTVAQFNIRVGGESS